MEERYSRATHVTRKKVQLYNSFCGRAKSHSENTVWVYACIAEEREHHRLHAAEERRDMLWWSS